jgi:hypothetical protein
LAIEHRRAFLEMYQVTHRSTWKHKTKLKKKKWYKGSSREFHSKNNEKVWMSKWFQTISLFLGYLSRNLKEALSSPVR